MATCWERADPLALVYDVLLCFCTFPCCTRLHRFLILATFSYFVTSNCGLGSLKTPCELVLHQQQNLEQTFGTSKMHLSPPLPPPPPPPPPAKAVVRSKAVVLLLLISTPIMESCYCSMFCASLYSLTYLLTGDRREA